MNEIIVKVFREPDGFYSVYVYDGHDGYMECAEVVADVCGTTWRDALDRGVEMANEALSGRE